MKTIQRIIALSIVPLMALPYVLPASAHGVTQMYDAAGYRGSVWCGAYPKIWHKIPVVGTVGRALIGNAYQGGMVVSSAFVTRNSQYKRVDAWYSVSVAGGTRVPRKVIYIGDLSLGTRNYSSPFRVSNGENNLQISGGGRRYGPTGASSFYDPGTGQRTITASCLTNDDYEEMNGESQLANDIQFVLTIIGQRSRRGVPRLR